ncbi:MAG: OadG family protein [Ruminococcus sp.]|nr:OadG family protein [Ruminococcus sp.]
MYLSELLYSAPELLLKGSDKKLDGGTITSVVITGLTVVFIGLILLILFVSIYGKAFDFFNKKKAAKAKAESEAKLKEAAKGAPVPKAAVVKSDTPAPVVEDGIGDEVVAVIAAAIAAMGAANGKKLALRSIKTAKGARSAWASAGAVENTRPF